MGASALFGFPTTYILANEIANSVGENDAEKNYLRSHLQPHMVIAGIMNATDLEYGLQYCFVEWYIWCSFIKSLFFAFIIASVSACYGLAFTSWV